MEYNIKRTGCLFFYKERGFPYLINSTFLRQQLRVAFLLKARKLNKENT